MIRMSHVRPDQLPPRLPTLALSHHQMVTAVHAVLRMKCLSTRVPPAETSLFRGTSESTKASANNHLELRDRSPLESLTEMSLLKLTTKLHLAAHSSATPAIARAATNISDRVRSYLKPCLEKLYLLP